MKRLKGGVMRQDFPPIVNGASLRTTQIAELNESSQRAPLNEDLMLPQPRSSNLRVQRNEYAELKQIVKQNGLLNKQPAYYTRKIFFTLGLLALSLIFLVIIDNPWLQLLNAVYFAFVFVQIGFIGHDAGHRQILDTIWKNDLIGLVFGNLLIGVSRGWWIDKHNRHHSHPNQLEVDPDISIPVLAFSAEQARSKQRLLRVMVKYQAFMFFPLMMVEAFYMRIISVQFLLQTKTKHALAEAILLGCHFVLYFGLIFYLLGGWWAVLFIIIHYVFFGIYMGLVFAPNHKGVLVLEEDGRLDFLHQQILTARNIKAHPLIDFWYGGLNYQIEHHLFPNMPRNNL